MLSGKKVGLRAVERNDLPLLQAWRNRPDFRINFRENKELSLENQNKWFDNQVVNSERNFMFTIVDLNNNEPIGAAGLLYTDWVARFADFSFYIGKDGTYIDDNGMADEAALLLLQYGFEVLNLNKIWMELYEFDAKKIEFFIDVILSLIVK